MADISERVSAAVSEFWQTKSSQLAHSVDSSNRGSVTAGKQLNGFIELLRSVCLDAGVPEECLFDRNNYIPGFSVHRKTGILP